MFNYIKVFSGNFNEVHQVFNELVLLNVCAIIRDKSEFESKNSIMHSNKSQRIILVHKDELDRALKIIKHLASELQT